MLSVTLTVVVDKLTIWGDRSGNKIVDAFVPLAEMFGYSTDLRSATQGRATYSMEFDHYEEVPKNVSEEIQKKRNG